VAGGEATDPDDRDDHDPLHACLLSSLLQVVGGDGEELGRRLLVGRGTGGRVDDHLDAGEGLRETFAGDHVHAGGSRHRDDFVSGGLEHVDDVPADPSGRSRYRNLVLGWLHD
jgi:hypothetical protein